MRSVSSTMIFQTSLLLLLLMSAVMVNAVPAPYQLSSKQIADFHRDGVIVIRGLLKGETLQDAIETAQTLQKSQGWVQRLVHKIFPAYRNLEFQSYRKHEALQKVAFDSSAPTICAKLMGLDKEGDKKNTRSLRLLKEAILGFSRGDTGCGWHVDDKLFWPCEDIHEDFEEADTRNKSKNHRIDAGINVWITLSPLTSKEGGGLAVAPRSHNLTGRGRVGKIAQKARRAIVSKGFQTQCILDEVDPSCHDYMERCKRVYDLQPGDAIIHDRYMFHKTENFSEGMNDNGKAETKNRISIRYMPSDATFFNSGAGFDGAANEKNLETGDPLWKGGEYFPQVWPCQLEEEVEASPKDDIHPFGSKFFVNTIKMILPGQKQS